MFRVSILFLLSLFIISTPGAAQTPEQPESPFVQDYESQAERLQADVEDDRRDQELSWYRKHPLNLNSADEKELTDLKLLSALQVKQFTVYRTLLGKLISIYELQSIPSWDPETIERIKPFVEVSDQIPLHRKIFARFKEGDHTLLLRAARGIEKDSSYLLPDSSSARYAGDPNKLLIRYHYNDHQLLQYGVTAEKDAGESFFSGQAKQGFDFYSGHLFIRKAGIFRSIALGDFTVNFGQGLIQWQSLAFTKTSDPLAVKRQSEWLKPYNSSGEYNFHRGIGFTIEKHEWAMTLYASLHKISVSLVPDTLGGPGAFSSFDNSGYHRTFSEINRRNNTRQFSSGGNIQWTHGPLQLGVNFVYYQFSRNIQKQQLPYNRYAIDGNTWHNLSAEYSYTWKNIHLFGEAALDAEKQFALSNGALVSLGRNAELSLIYRNIARGYQSIFGDAFTESNLPTNETGYYAGFVIRPVQGWQVNVWADFYSSSWIRYRVDAPGGGNDYLIKLSRQLSKACNIYVQYRSQSKTGNLSATDQAMRLPLPVSRQNIRIGVNYVLNAGWTIKNRVDLATYAETGRTADHEFLVFTDIFTRLGKNKFSLNTRLAYFESGSYQSGIYTYENDVQFSNSTPLYSGKGYRYIINLKINFKKTLSIRSRDLRDIILFLRWSQQFKTSARLPTIYNNNLYMNRSSEVKIQLLFSW